MKATAQTAVIWLFLIFVTAASLTGYIREQSKSKRLLYNLKAARDSAQTFTTRDGHQASKLIAQNLTAPELRKVNPEVVSQLKNLYISPRLVQSYTQSTQEMKAEVMAVIKDSIPERTAKFSDTTRFTVGNIEPVEPKKIRMLEYSDKWISIKANNIDLSPVKITVLATDTIFTAIYKGERRHPWAWFLSRRQYTAAATNRSPYIKINVIQSGVIKK